MSSKSKFWLTMIEFSISFDKVGVRVMQIREHYGKGGLKIVRSKLNIHHERPHKRKKENMFTVSIAAIIVL